MRMPKIILSLMLLVFAISAQAQQPKTALEMNDYLSSVTDSVYAKGQAWGKHLNELSKGGNFKNLATERKDVQQYILRKEKDLKALKDVSGSGPLRQGLLDFLAVEKVLVEKAFMPFEQLTVNSTEDDFQKLINGLMTEAKTEGDALKKVQTLQEAYAKANGFKLEPTENK